MLQCVQDYIYLLCCWDGESLPRKSQNDALENNKENFSVSKKRSIVDYSICYQGKELQLVGYSHAIWAGDLDEGKSTSRYTFLLNNGVGLQKSKKQTCIALSTMEAEFIVCSVVI